MIWLVIWVVLMVLWLFLGAWALYPPAGGSPPANAPALYLNALIPWLCVLILGLVVFGAVSAGAWPGPPAGPPR